MPVVALLLLAAPTASRVACGADGVLFIDGRPTLPIGFTMPPPVDGVAPNGEPALAELRDAGATFLRTGAQGGPWDEAAIERERQYLDAAAALGLHTWTFLRELGSIAPGQDAREAMLRRVVTEFRDHPGLGVWKGVDEPQWGKAPIEPLIRAREIIRELDPHHPVALTHAPRGTVDELRAYNVACEITGADIYPIGYPPGAHSLDENKQISMVGDFTRKMRQVGDDGRPVWMILQICWSGVARPGKTLRFPTFAEERFMVYQALINGARGLIFFGGHMTAGLAPEDLPRGWNWRFWNRVLRPVIEEIGDRGPLYPALLAPDSTAPVVLEGATDVEWCLREVGDELFLLACKREGETVQVTFRALPAADGPAEVLYEPPRTVTVVNGAFTDWFAPFEVHVYRMRQA